MGRNGTIFGSGFFGATGPVDAGAAVAAGCSGTDGSTGSGGGATGATGSGMITSGSRLATSGGSTGRSEGETGFGFTMVAAGFTSTGVSSSSVVFALRARAAFFAPSAPSTAPSADTAAFLGTRFGFGSSGSSRPFPSFTRSAFASVVSRGVMARTPLCPISSAATIRSLLVTPSSFASSMTFIFAAATAASPPRDPRHVRAIRRSGGRWCRLRSEPLHRRRQLRRRLRGRAEGVREPAALQHALHAGAVPAHVGAPAGRRAARVYDHDTARHPHEPDQVTLRPAL